jgi:transglutaminase-like putative cysteine protease
LCHRIFTEFSFDSGFSDVTTPLDAVLQARRGVCQDFAHVACAALRSIGLPARYVSGYIETAPPPGEPKLVGVDASHAWCAVWAGECGWIDFDPTNDQMPPQRHVTVGWGRDYDDVAPVRGVVIGPGGGQTLSVSVDVVSENRQ